MEFYFIFSKTLVYWDFKRILTGCWLKILNTHRTQNSSSTVSHTFALIIDKYTGWTKKKGDLKKYVYCSEGHKNQANQILILCMFFSTLGHLV